ncbi:MAG: DUF2029 domain-containing protein [Planctomycetes bacterium]|nr:DUF2029 domain-containing protein [Planctomycetota bacterium]
MKVEPTDCPTSPRAYQTTLLSRLDDRFTSTRKARIALVAILGIILIVPSVQFAISIHKTQPSDFRAGGERHDTALGRWLPTAELVTQKDRTENPYGFGHWFPLPPLVLMLLAPLSSLGFTGASIVWILLKIGGLVLGMTLLIRALGRDDFAVPIGVIFITAVFALRPIVSDIQHGNVNVFMLIWIALAWAMYLRKQDFLAGLFVAAAIVTKLTPALLLLYFLYKREWRVCIGATIGLLVFVILVPGLYFGFQENFALLESWFNMLVRPFSVDGYAAIERRNQSLYGVLIRIGGLSGVIPLQEMSIEQKLVAGMKRMARPESEGWRLIRPAISLTLIGSLVWLCRARCVSRKDPRRLLELALVLLAMLLLSERTWKHHGTTVAIVYLAVWYALTCVPWPERFRSVLVALLAVQWVLLVGSSVGLLGNSMAKKLLMVGAFTWGWLLCFVQIAIMLRYLRGKSEPRATRSAA